MLRDVAGQHDGCEEFGSGCGPITEPFWDPSGVHCSGPGDD